MLSSLVLAPTCNSHNSTEEGIKVIDGPPSPSLPNEGLDSAQLLANILRQDPVSDVVLARLRYHQLISRGWHPKPPVHLSTLHLLSTIRGVIHRRVGIGIMKLKLYWKKKTANVFTRNKNVPKRYCTEMYKYNV